MQVIHCFSTVKIWIKMDENLPWLTQKTKGKKKVIKEALLFPHTE